MPTFIGERNGFSNICKEKKEIQRIWDGITINNSWEDFIVNAPHSLFALEKLMVESLKTTYFSSYSEPPRCKDDASVKKRSFTENSFNNDLTVRSDDFVFKRDRQASKPHLVETINEAQSSFEKTVEAMVLIGQNVEELPKVVEGILDIIIEPNLERIEKDLDIKFKRLQKVVEKCAEPAFSLESIFAKLDGLTNGRTSKVGRTGFMLLKEVRYLWGRISKFFLEVSKLIEFALDPACNSLIEKISEQLDLMLRNRKYVPKTKATKDIYRNSLAIVVYSLVLRHIAVSYVQFTNQFVLPQINMIFQYSIVCNSEVELQKTQQQFRTLNNASRKGIERMMQVNRQARKRPSVLEIDFGLDLHLSDIATEVNESIYSIASFPEKVGAKSPKDYQAELIKARMNGFVTRVRGKFVTKQRSNTL